ncbi:MAG: acylneuraminate cytidylyltransferase family protein [Acidobacteriota bacterium]|nr:acylneuraminate cytidylyltransferase family protein [Acidobacteriota bacterium]
MSESPSVVALIPARSGSTRVPDKNIRGLGGHPLLAYSIASALEARVFGQVVVSTNDETTANVARHYGADVPFLRPTDMAGARSPDIEWVEHALHELAGGGRHFDCFAILRPTSPFRTADTIRRGWTAFCASSGVDSLRAVERCRQHPGKMWVIRGERLLPLLPLGPAEQPWHSSQMPSLPEVWVQNASLEIAWTRVALEGHTIAGHTLIPFRTDEREGFDINDHWDWQLAEAMVQQGRWALPPVTRPPHPAVVPATETLPGS